MISLTSSKDELYAMFNMGLYMVRVKLGRVREGNVGLWSVKAGLGWVMWGY